MFRSQSEGSGSYETGFTTDFPDMQRTIQLEKHRFTAALRDHPNGTLYLVSDSSQRQYVGLPNTAIDNNWDALTHGRYVQLTAPETSLLHQDTQPTQTISFAPFGSTQRPAVYAGPDVLHSLHCLNAMRKHLDSTYYAASMDLPEEYRRMHMDHCIDQLRQSIMCHADLTPVTLKPVWEGGEEGPKKTVFYLGQTEREHTCRRWEDVRAWVDERGEGGKALDFH
ncbi:hypothetical protein N0V86_006739 [Didymella sp. IMI 355093]|nr:hypothetical protein N0V86_006739 [Didymella sp. IMI 355093]